MRQAICRILRVLSIVACVAIVVLWVRSYWVGENVSYHTVAGDRCSVTAGRGTFMAEFQSNVVYFAANDRPVPGLAYRDRGAPSDFGALQWQTATQWRAAGFGLVINRGSGVRRSEWAMRPGGWQNTVVLIPFWTLLVGAAVPIVTSAIAFLRQRRGSESPRCAGCGYDIRATPDRCPECGKSVPIAPAE